MYCCHIHLCVCVLTDLQGLETQFMFSFRGMMGSALF